MKHCFQRLLFILFVNGCASAAVASEWSVTEVSNTLEIVVRPAAVETLSVDGGVVVRAGKDAAFVEPGEPDLPVLVHVLRARPGQRASLVGVEAGDEREEDLSVLPRAMETVETVDDNLVRRVTLRNGKPEIFEQNAYWPQSQAALSEAVMGTNAYIRVAVYPARYNPVARRLQVAGWVRVRVSFNELDENPSKQGP